MADPATLACVAAQHANGTAPAWGPASLVRWLSPRASKWCYGGSGAGRFDATFLIDWGARWAPAMSGRCARGCTRGVRLLLGNGMQGLPCIPPGASLLTAVCRIASRHSC